MALGAACAEQLTRTADAFLVLEVDACWYLSVTHEARGVVHGTQHLLGVGWRGL